MLEAVTGELTTAMIIIVVVVFSVTLDFIQEHRAERAANALRRAASVIALGPLVS